MKSYTILFCMIIWLFSSCSNDDFSNTVGNDALTDNSSPSNALSTADKEGCLAKFATVLSKVVYERKDVREFLKKESLKQFDKNYDVLYYLVKDESIGDKSFRDILISYSSSEAIEEIEANVPLLNMLVPEIAFFDVHPENLDVNDSEIPVVVSKSSETSLFFNGNEELKLAKGEIPNFHVFVVNENSRVVSPQCNPKDLKSAGAGFLRFKSPNFDGRLINLKQPAFRSVNADFTVVGQKTIDAFSYFNKNDGSINQKAFQRDYVYYGITPSNPVGSLNNSVSEYISYIEVNPNSYFTMADQRNTTFNNDDPYIRKAETTQYKRGLSEAELLDRLWTKGAYNLKFEIITSTMSQPHIVYIPLRPDEIWDFHVENTYVHSTWFRHSKYTYKIDPNKITSKKVFLDEMVGLGKWNISEESLYRYVRIYEEDESVEVTETETYDMSTALKFNFSANGKVGVGLKVADNVNGWSAAVNLSTTEKLFKIIATKRKQDSDFLGKARMYFYDPLVNDVSLSTKMCSMRSYNAGSVLFGITVK